MAEEQKKLSTDTWDDFSGVYMKAEDVKEWPLKVVPKNIEAYMQENKAKLDITVEYNGRDRKIGLNKSNQDVLKAAKIKAPKDVIGKVLTFVKAKVTNPSTGKMQDSLALDTVE